MATPSRVDEHARDLRAGDRGPVDREGAGKDEHRERALEDSDVDGRGRMGGDVVERIEGREAERAHGRDEHQALADDRPVASDLRMGEHREQAERAQPAQGDQRHGRDLADRQAPEDRVGAPAERGQREQEIRPPTRDGGRGLRGHASRQTVVLSGRAGRSPTRQRTRRSAGVTSTGGGEGVSNAVLIGDLVGGELVGSNPDGSNCIDLAGFLLVGYPPVSSRQQALHVTFTLRRAATRIRAISARDMSRKERAHHAQEN